MTKGKKPKCKHVPPGQRNMIYTIQVVCGHKDCVPKGRLPNVPKRMGWLWTAKDVVGGRYDPAWRPGAVMKCFGKGKGSPTTDSAEVVTGPGGGHKKSKKKRRSNTETVSSEQEDRIESAFSVKKRNGNYHITVQAIKDAGTRHVSAYPYEENSKPFQYLVENRTPEEITYHRKKMERKERNQRKAICQEAFDNICNEVYNSINQAELYEIASKRNECPCCFLQTEIINNLIDSYISNQSVKEGSSSSDNLANANGIQSELMNFLIESYVNHDGDSSETSSGSSGAWSIEFTPPCAKYSPFVKIVEKKYACKQTQAVPAPPTFDDRKKSTVQPPPETAQENFDQGPTENQDV